MGRFLDIADRALQSVGEGQKRPAKPMDPLPTHCERSEKSERSERSPDRLRDVAGTTDWPEISGDSRQLEALWVAAKTAEQIRRGIVPEHYTSMTTCRRCGPVPIFEGCPPEVLGCPWCFARAAGQAVLRPPV